MPWREMKWASAAAVLVTVCGSASAYFSVGSDPATWGFVNLVASTNTGGPNAGYNYPANTGHTLFAGPVQVDETFVSSEVYSVTSAQVITTSAGNFALNQGDRVWAYRVRLVTESASTVSSLRQAQVAGSNLISGGIQDDLYVPGIISQAYVDPAHGRFPNSANTDYFPGFGGTADFIWPGGDAQNLDNGLEIIMLLFTGNLPIGNGQLHMEAPPGQQGGIVSILQTPNAPPIYIPIIPSPGSVGLAGAALAVVFVPRRRRDLLV